MSFVRSALSFLIRNQMVWLQSLSQKNYQKKKKITSNFGFKKRARIKTVAAFNPTIPPKNTNVIQKLMSIAEVAAAAVGTIKPKKVARTLR